jgi:hypothetical protein
MATYLKQSQCRHEEFSIQSVLQTVAEQKVNVPIACLRLSQRQPAKSDRTDKKEKERKVGNAGSYLRSY